MTSNSQIHAMMAALESKLGTFHPTPPAEVMQTPDKASDKISDKASDKTSDKPSDKVSDKIIEITLKPKSAPAPPPSGLPPNNDQTKIMQSFSEKDQSRLREFNTKELAKLLSLGPHILKSLLNLPTSACFKKASALSCEHMERLVSYSLPLQEFILSIYLGTYK